MACLSTAALAHHSTAEFDYTKQVTIKGMVKVVQWTNPHSYIQLMTDGTGSEKVLWSVEIGSPSLNINMGWRKNSVKPADVDTMNLSPARNGKPYGTLLCAITLASGVADAADAGRAAQGAQAALLGIWVPDAAPRQLKAIGGKALPLTAEASKLYAERRQRLARGDAVDPPLPLTMGFPTGRWEGSTLVIRTTGLIDTTVLDASGLPHSEQLSLTERLRVLPDGRLEDRITMADPRNGCRRQQPKPPVPQRRRLVRTS